MYNYNISVSAIFERCIKNSIIHAIMMCDYPELSYEHSWDLLNYSTQDGQGKRGTISFCKDGCFAGIRDEHAKTYKGVQIYRDLLINCPTPFINLAQKETFEYLLEESNETIEPSISLAFWCDRNTFYSNLSFEQLQKNGVSLISTCFSDEHSYAKHWKNYYGISDEKIKLAEELSCQKINNFYHTLVLNDNQTAIIGVNQINEECKNSFAELRIIIN